MSDTPNPGLPEPLRRFSALRQKIPPFARYKGT